MNSGSVAARLVLALLLCSTTAVWGQVTTATLYGTVQDSTGAVIPGGGATLTNDNTGLVYTAPISGTGDFVFLIPYYLHPRLT